ncbi:MAG: FtsW/RodA/SpoVE family cell cycle protein [Actinomycetota bacterium]|nr:FtsW/RodA/SpoVE family cell cycle protein [Actinomycetota bacterium]
MGSVGAACGHVGEGAFNLRSSPRNKELLLLLLASTLAFVGWVSVDLAREGRVQAGDAVYPAVLTAFFIAAHLFLRFLRSDVDYLLLPLTAALCFVGITFLFRLDRHMANLQMIWMGVGVAAMTVLLAFLKDYKILQRYRYTLAVAGLLLLLSTMLPVIGQEVNGSRLWLVLGPLRFQPSELAKILLAVFFAAYLAEKKELLVSAGRSFVGLRFPRLKDLGPLLTMWALSLLLLIFQKDLGSSLLFFGIFLAMLYVATSRVSFVVVGLILFIMGAMVTFFIFGHVQERVTVWVDPLNPETIDEESYQMAQSLFAFAEGGLTGEGLARGYPEIIPFVETDFIFAAIGEELGLFGAAACILLYLMLAARGLYIALRSRIGFGLLLAVGLTTIIALQSFIIMGGVTRLVPLTGITLPFVSYGGSSLFSNFLLIGLLLCISREGEEVA